MTLPAVKQNNLLIILILGALTTISPFSIDLYLPSFQKIAADLGVTTSRVSLSLASYFAGLAIGQILYGPLLDRFGRKHPLYIGLGIYLIASFGCLNAHHVNELIAFRFFQAIGGCAAGVGAMAMVRDFFPVNESAKIFSLLILILSVSPLLAPTVGSFIAMSLGWHWVFIALIIVVILNLVAIYFLLPEGHAPDTSISLKPKPILGHFWLVLREPQFYTYAVASAFSFSGLFVYVAESPIIFMEIYHVSPHMYGGIFAFLSVGFIGASQVNIWLLKSYKSERIFQAALICQAVVGSVFLAAVLNHWIGLYGTIGLFFAFLACAGLTCPNASALALAPFSKNAGSASSLIGFLQIGVASIASIGVGLLDIHDSYPAIAILTVTTFIGLFVLMIGKRHIETMATEAHTEMLAL